MFLQKLINITIYLLVFLLPLFWLPFTVEQFEFNKIYLLVFLVSAGILLWLAKMILKDKEITFKKTSLDIFIFVFLLIIILNTVFSLEKITNLYGFYGRFWPNLVGMLGLGLFYFLVSNNIELDRKAQSVKRETTTQSVKLNNFSKFFRKIYELRVTSCGLQTIFLSSIFIVVLITYLSLFGIIKDKFFNTISQSMDGLAIFLSIVFVFLIGILSFRITRNVEISKYRYVAIAALAALMLSILFLLILIDFFSAWIVIILSLSLFLGFAFWKRIFKEYPNQLALPIIAVIISLIFLFSNPLQNFFQQISFFKDIPKEILLSQRMSWTIGIQGLKEDLVLGTGIGTFNYIFNKFKPQSILESNLWNLNFSRAGNHIAEIVGTTGILGVLSYFVLIAMFLILSWKILRLKFQDVANASIQDKDIFFQMQTQIPALFGFIACLISQFVYYQTVMLAFTFWFFIILGAASWNSLKKEKSFVFAKLPELGLVFTILFYGILIGTSFFYFTIAKYYLADLYYKDYLKNPQQQLDKLEQVVNLNNLNPQYRIALAQHYLAEAANEFKKPQQDNQRILKLVASSIEQGKKASEIAPNRADIYYIQGFIYEQIQGLVQGADEWALKNYKKAIDLDPKNIQIYFVIGQHYYNKGEDDKAANWFQSAIELFPNHSNSRYLLGLIYEKKGEKQKALKEFEKVLELNPNNGEIMEKIERLKQEI